MSSDPLFSPHLPGGQDLPDKGPQPVTGAAPFSLEHRYRVAWYVDGFNLYHAVDALRDAELKWLNLRSLADSYLRPNQDLHSVTLFTALNTWDAEKRARHMNYVAALEAMGVEVCKARFDTVTKYCEKGGRSCRFRQEKQSDVGMATRALSDAYDAGVDNLFFLTADSDQIPVFRLLRQRFPEKRIFLVAPPKRLKEARELGSLAHHVFELTAGRLRDHPLPPTVRDVQGRLIAARPSVYRRHGKAPLG